MTSVPVTYLTFLTVRLFFPEINPTIPCCSLMSFFLLLPNTFYVLKDHHHVSKPNKAIFFNLTHSCVSRTYFRTCYYFMGYHQLSQTKMLKAGDSIPAKTLLALRKENCDFRVFLQVIVQFLSH